MKKTKILIHVFIGIPVLLLILFSNRLIGSTLDGFQKVDLKDFAPTSSNKVYCCPDRLESMGTYKEMFNIEGWAFIESDRTENKKIAVLLKSDDECYGTWANLRDRTDVYDVYCDTVSLTGKDAGFWIELPTLPLKSGTYELLIYCKENDETEGLANTGWLIIKDGKNVRVKNTLQ